MTALTLARPADLDRLCAQVATCEAEAGRSPDMEVLRTALAPLLDGSPHGAAYLIGPVRAPIGHVILSFGWSLAQAGLTGRIDQLYIRAAVRGRGVGSEVMGTLPRALAGAGLKALWLSIDREDARARALHEKLRFAAQDDMLIMLRRL